MRRPNTQNANMFIPEDDTCSGCSLSFYRCSLCKGFFEAGEKVVCVSKGEEHLCEMCYEENYGPIE